MTATLAPEHDFLEGQLVRHRATRRLIRLGSINPNPACVADGESWAEVDSSDGSPIELLSPDDVEHVSIPDPTPAAVASTIDFFGASCEALRVDSTEADGDQVHVEGYLNGIPVTFTLQVSNFVVGI